MENEGLILLQFNDDRETVFTMLDDISSKTIRKEEKILFPFDNNYLTIELFKKEDRIYIIKPFSGIERTRYMMACSYISYVLKAKMSNTFFYGYSEFRESVVDIEGMILENLEAVVDYNTQIK